jgi:hypothetical protein
VAERQQDVLRIEPQMIPSLRAEFRRAVDQISSALTDLKRRAYITSPWLADEISEQVATHYTSRALDEPESSYQSLIAYRDELTRVHDTLQQMEADYRRREGDNAALWGRRA